MSGKAEQKSFQAPDETRTFENGVAEAVAGGSCAGQQCAMLGARHPSLDADVLTDVLSALSLAVLGEKNLGVTISGIGRR